MQPFLTIAAQLMSLFLVIAMTIYVINIALNMFKKDKKDDYEKREPKL